MASSDVIATLRARMAEIESGLLSESVDSFNSKDVSESISVELETEEAAKAFKKIKRLACVQEQASVALRRRLLREGFSDAAVEKALSRALRCCLVDDSRYADVLVRSRLSQGKGRRGIERELANLGLLDKVYDQLYDFDGADEHSVEFDRALALLRQKPPRSKRPREAAYRRLVQKGYSSAIASSAARAWYESCQNNLN